MKVESLLRLIGGHGRVSFASEDKGPVATSLMSLASEGSFTFMSRRTQLSCLAYAKYRTATGW